jgi:hypothetical protein
MKRGFSCNNVIINKKTQFNLVFRVLLLFIFSLSGSEIKSQVPDLKIKGILEDVSIDTLVKNVRILSGEDSVRIGSQKQLIADRVSGSPTNILAGNYIKQKLKSFDLKTYEQYFTGYSWMGFGDLVSGRNIYAIQEGEDTTAKYIICAHYDAATSYCADDNASGTAVVLEAARILSRLKPQCTIIYAFWDQEEAWLVGSNAFAHIADSIHMNIQGVLNIDMVGWDGNNDGLAEIHTDHNYHNSVQLAQMLKDLNSTHYIGLNINIIDPGQAYSDNVSFAVPAVLFIESYSSDFNPYYHSVNERISYFNLGYFKRMAKLAIAGIATLASISITAVEKIEIDETGLSLEQNYPNPVSNYTTFSFFIPEKAYSSLDIYNSLGNKIIRLISAELVSGSHQIKWDAANLPDGIYYYKLTSGGKAMMRKMIVLH